MARNKEPEVGKDDVRTDLPDSPEAALEYVNSRSNVDEADAAVTAALEKWPEDEGLLDARRRVDVYRAGRENQGSDESDAGANADPNAEVSSTGTANVAGTPQSQLNQAPPQTDESGSNIPAPNLRQPLAEGADPAAGASSATKEGLDPALVDPETAAKQRVEGRTSDASLRAADGPQIDEVPADVNDGPKPSDGGPEAYPFPQGGDVDVATVPTDTNDGEYYPNLEIEDAVILGEHELVPERLWGRRALVVDAPRYLVPMDQKDNVYITVQTRDEANARLTIPLAAVKGVQKGVVSTVRG